jgi:hypothetical protein
MFFFNLLVSLLSSQYVAAVYVNAGYDAYKAAQVMIDRASHSWEWGTSSQALLELLNNEFSVFSDKAFPGGHIPRPDPTITPLAYAKKFIHTQGKTLVEDTAVGDPASLGVSAILLGTSDNAYMQAARRQADFILNEAPRYSNGAISHRVDIAELWADNMAMSFPFRKHEEVVGM